jgi:hypothetical protein
MSDPLHRIVADNDPRNGGIVARILRSSEHPERQPDTDGLYRDEYAKPGWLEQRMLGALDRKMEDEESI